MVEITKTCKYLVKEKGWNVSSRHADNPWVWFRVISNCESQGLSVRIPLYHETYSEEMTAKLDSLSEGDVVEGQLRRETEDDPWLPIELETVA